MQVTNYAVGHFVDTNYNKFANQQDTQQINREIQNTQQAKLKHNSNQLNIVKELNDLKQVQSDFNKTLWSNNYLEKLQRVLERFREFNREIAQELIKPSSAKAVEKSENFNNEMEQLFNEFPLLKEVITELGNFKVRSFIGTNNKEVPTENIRSRGGKGGYKKLLNNVDKAISSVEQKRIQLQKQLGEIEDRITLRKPNQNDMKVLMSDIKNNQMPSSIHRDLESSQVIELMA